MKYQSVTTVDAFIWTGDARQEEDPEWAIQGIKDGKIKFKDENVVVNGVIGHPGCFIVRDEYGHLFTCPAEPFLKAYSPVV